MTARKPRNRRERFEAKVDRSRGPKACHPWTASIRRPDARALFHDASPYTGKSTMRDATRVAMEFKLGRPLERHEKVRHRKGCSRRCVNPDHLHVGALLPVAAPAPSSIPFDGRKLSDKQVLKVVELHRDHSIEHCFIAERFGISHQTINAILSGAAWSSVTGIAPKKKQPANARDHYLSVEQNHQFDMGAVW